MESAARRLFLKLNEDGVVDSGDGRRGIGLVVHDLLGTSLEGFVLLVVESWFFECS